MTTYNTIPDDEALLAPKKQKSFKGLVAGAAMASFLLGMVAATAVSTKPMDAGKATAVAEHMQTQLNTKGGDQYWWQDGGVNWRTVSVANAEGEYFARDSTSKSLNLAQLGARRRVDGVEDDAMIQHERAVKF